MYAWLKTFAANPLSVSQISSEGGASCGLFGVDGSETTVVGANTVDVSPPQSQVSGSCLALWGESRFLGLVSEVRMRQGNWGGKWKRQVKLWKRVDRNWVVLELVASTGRRSSICAADLRKTIRQRKLSKDCTQFAAARCLPRALLKYGADFIAQDRKERSPLHLTLCSKWRCSRLFARHMKAKLVHFTCVGYPVCLINALRCTPSDLTYGSLFFWLECKF